MSRCICGCRKRAVQLHHAIYSQQAKRAGADLKDPRNLVPVALACHQAHHDRTKPLALSMLPDSVFEYAAEVIGPGPAYNYLTRRYSGEDPRLEALL